MRTLLARAAWAALAVVAALARPGPSRAAFGPEPAAPADRTSTPTAPAPAIAFSETTVRTARPAVAGSKVVLDVDASLAAGARFQWFQVEGPAVALGDPTRPSLTVTVPPGAERLGFVVIAAKAEVVKVLKVVIPVRGGALSAVTGEPTVARAYPGAPTPGATRADAGDDQVGLVGHRVTLNGSRSVPDDGKTARWMQTEGPAALAPRQQGPFFSFIPPSPGAYRFALVVSGDGEISEPDEVTVLVGTPPAAAAAPPEAAAPATASILRPPAALAQPVAPPVSTVESVVAEGVRRIPDGPRVAGDVADVMEAVAVRSGLYSSFASLQNEMARRLDVVIPTDPADRQAWAESVLIPLTVSTATELGSVGLDLRAAGPNPSAMTPAQRDRVRDHFLTLARAFRAASAPAGR